MNLSESEIVRVRTLENYWRSVPKDFIAHQQAYQRMQWFHGFPELKSNESEFNVGVISNDNPLEYLNRRLQRVQIDEYGIVMVMKTLNGQMILITNHEMTKKTVISVPNPCTFIGVYRSAKFVCVVNPVSTGQAKVYCRQTGKKLYTFRGNIGSKLLDNVLDDLYVREYNQPILSIFKLTETGSYTVFETTGCCSMKSFKRNFVPSPSGLLLLSVCSSCWKANKSVLNTNIWELQIKPLNDNPVRAHTTFSHGVFTVELFHESCDTIEAIFIDPDLGCIIQLDCDKDGKDFRYFQTKQLLILTWQSCGYQKICVYNKIRRQVQRKIQVMISSSEQNPFVKAIHNRILVVTFGAPEQTHRVRIMVA